MLQDNKNSDFETIKINQLKLICQLNIGLQFAGVHREINTSASGWVASVGEIVNMQAVRNSIVLFATVIAAVLFHSSEASAVILTGELPSNTYITFNGLDWAWASPYQGVDITAEQSGFGWRQPTADELSSSPTALQFLISGGNATYAASLDYRNNGTTPVSPIFNYLTGDYLDAQSDGACASAYFSPYWSCDFAQGLGQTDGTWHGPWIGMSGAQPNGEWLLVRTAAVQAPEPGSAALFGAGLFLLLAVARRPRPQTNS